MKKILVAAVATMIAFAAGSANAQCIGCQQNAQPVFGSAPIQSYSAPIQSYSAPIQSYPTALPNCNCCDGGVIVGQPIYGGTITSGTVIYGGAVEGSIISSDPVISNPVEASAPVEDAVEPVPAADATEPPVPPVSTPGPEADGT